MELELYSKTVVFGRNFVVIQFTGCEYDVAPYTDAYDAIKSVTIEKDGTAYTSQKNGQTYILVFHEGLWMGDLMYHSLANPNQLRYDGTTVQDNPFSYSPLYIMSEDDDFYLPLETKGTNIFANNWTPTSQELVECLHITFTSQHPRDPHSVEFPTTTRSVQEKVEM